MIGTGKHISEYKLLSDDDPKALAAKVNAAIHDGWQPHYGPSVEPRADGFEAVLVQAMVKYADRF